MNYEGLMKLISACEAFQRFAESVDNPGPGLQGAVPADGFIVRVCPHLRQPHLLC